jgi:hypothetical protein
MIEMIAICFLIPALIGLLIVIHALGLMIVKGWDRTARRRKWYVVGRAL